MILTGYLSKQWIADPVGNVYWSCIFLILNLAIYEQIFDV